MLKASDLMDNKTEDHEILYDCAIKAAKRFLEKDLLEKFLFFTVLPE
jgi:hypothetical protein